MLRVLSVVALLCVLLTANQLQAQEAGSVTTAERPAVGVEVPAADKPPSAPEAGSAPADEKQERQRQTALAGLMILGLICVVFLMLILAVIVYARRIRRLVREPLPEQHPGDPLWYLRRDGLREPPSGDE